LLSADLPKGSRKHLGAVVLGAYTKGKLWHCGYAGSGFTEKGLKDAVDRMKPLFIEKCPFVNPPNIKEKIQRVRPKLVFEVEYAELTADDQLRQTTKDEDDSKHDRRMRRRRIRKPKNRRNGGS
jgi:bifunctional non-homologous end joining protein LigD